MRAQKKKTVRPISPPDLPGTLDTLPVSDGVLEGPYSEGLIADWDTSNLSAHHLLFDAVVLENANLARTMFRQIKLRDVRIDRSDVSNGKWPSANLTRVEVLDGRLTGLQSPESGFSDVRFVRCKADLASFAAGSFRDVRFEDCSLRDADFSGSDLRGVGFPGCDLRGCNFTGAKLEGADFRRAQLEGILLRPEDLKGLIIDATQALELHRFFAQMLGVMISDE